MAGLTPLSFTQMKQLLIEKYNADAALPARTDAGSVLGPFFNAFALLAVQLQEQIAYENAIARLATSSGADVDTFVNPFGVTRLGASPSSGQELFSTASPVIAQIVVPVGAIVQTQGGLQYVVVADGTNPNFNLGLNGYPINVGHSSVSATIQCLTPGAIGNVAANQITQIYGGQGSTPLPGISTVTNPLGFPTDFNTGRDQESDAALKARFTLAVSSGPVATRNAILAAAAAVQTGLTLSLGDEINPDGSAHPAFFTIVVNVLGQSTGPSGNLLSAVSSAVDAVRSAGISFTTVAPTLVLCNAVANIKIAQNYDPAVVLPQVAAAYTAYVNNIGLDLQGNATTLSYIKVFGYLATLPGVADVTAATLNGGTVDITAAFAHQLVAGTTTFTAV